MTADVEQPGTEEADGLSDGGVEGPGERSQAWLTDNMPALESSNKHVEQHGLPLSRYTATGDTGPAPAVPVESFEVLVSFAKACRQGLFSLRNRPGSMFEGFPLGTCGPASELVGRLIKERLGFDGVYVCSAEHPTLSANQSHAWFEACGLIFDLTHDQFAGTGVDGWVLPLDSPWHRAFSDQDRRPGFCTPAGWPMYPHDGYAAMTAALDVTLG
jgi:hypothetical protein